MSPEAASLTRRRAVEMSGDESVVEGPLSGYHHETYVFPLPGTAGGGQAVRWKCREPRGGLLWFDRRCFASEEQLLVSLRGRISGIPEIIEADGLRLQRFVEGRTLGALWASGLPVPDALCRQIVRLFGEMAEVTPETLPVERRCRAADRPQDGDTDGFLERLVAFTEERVYWGNRDRFGGLFAALGLDGDCFRHLRKQVSGLSERPFCLLHADLHRENFVVDRNGRLWTIDWELALFGDPLYDLATHLYLMRYPARQAHHMARRWAAAVERVRAGSANGWQRDLNRLIAYKKAQSVFTDVIRVALSLDTGPDPLGHRLAGARRKIHRILAAAAGPLGMDSVPGHRQIGAALMGWVADHGRNPAVTWR
ncbi:MULTISPECIES: aminoglycoside phosphotransferase family protein [Streptomyces]|uniref:Aminoglycoside phosphotransferase n=2 Tax=Streptomyces TaxID=1883 RepID=A0A2U9P3B2_STRAS|nr:aminoglycoside phosphotransferase family protein [Streptomyces actuosus]AWT44037.1 aminoglycoside phosphotransferase [Streptomyces actuosus]MBM4820819.1 aminoglycoside phosphotransferase family protein [Streptomyces actuosus]